MRNLLQAPSVSALTQVTDVSALSVIQLFVVTKISLSALLWQLLFTMPCFICGAWIDEEYWWDKTNGACILTGLKGWQCQCRPCYRMEVFTKNVEVLRKECQRLFQIVGKQSAGNHRLRQKLYQINQMARINDRIGCG